MKSLKKIWSEIYFSDAAIYASYGRTIAKGNHYALKLFSFIGCILLALISIACILVPDVSKAAGACIIYSVIDAVFFIIAAFYIKTPTLKLIERACFAFILIHLSFGLVLTLYIYAGTVRGSLNAFLVLAPLLFTIRTRRITIFMVGFCLFTVFADFFISPPTVFKGNTSNILIYCTLAVFAASYSNRIKLERMVLLLEKKSIDIFISDMMRYSSLGHEPGEVINHILEYMGVNLKSDRAYIFEVNDEGTYDNTYEWCNDGVKPQIDKLTKIPREGVLDAWFYEYENSRNVMIYDMDEYRKVSPSLYRILKPQNINTLVTAPISIDGRIIGFFGVDNPPLEKMKYVSDILNMMTCLLALLVRIRNSTNMISHVATHDSLTGCKNRTALQWIYDGKFDKSKSITVVMCDLNGLKKANDEHGHLAGDALIRECAELVREVFGSDNTYRLGGDEFMGLVLGIDEEAAATLVSLVRRNIGNKASVGYAYRQQADLSFDEMLSLADVDMYSEKQQYYGVKGKYSR